MSIDTIFVKGSYDLHTQEKGVQSAFNKLLKDKKAGRELQTCKLPRYFAQNRDFLKFGFRQYQELSTLDFVVVSALMTNLPVYVVTSADLCEEVKFAAKVLGKKITAIPEFDVPLSEHPDPAKVLSASYTQSRGYAHIFKDNPQARVAEITGDLPFFYNIFQQAKGFTFESDLYANLNALDLMRSCMKTFKRNGYFSFKNSEGRISDCKEPNLLFVNQKGAESFLGQMNDLYQSRNGGDFRKVILKKIANPFSPVPILNQYESVKILGKTLLSSMFSSSIERGIIPHNLAGKVASQALGCRVTIDATNWDPTSCWDNDGLNNDYLFSRRFFEQNWSELSLIHPHADALNEVNNAKKDSKFAKSKIYDFMIDDFTARVNAQIYTHNTTSHGNKIEPIELSLLGGKILGKVNQSEVEDMFHFLKAVAIYYQG